MLKKQLIDQAAHFLLAIAILLPVAHAPGLVSFTFAGCCLGVLREATEPDPILSKGSLLDILFWTLGGLAAGILAA